MSGLSKTLNGTVTVNTTLEGGYVLLKYDFKQPQLAVHGQPRGLSLLHPATSVLKNSQVAQIVQAGCERH
jgi:hypothetical protein